MIDKKIVYSFFGFLVIVLIIVLRVRSAFRDPFLLIYPLQDKIVVLLVGFLFIFCFSIYLSLRALLYGDKSNKFLDMLFDKVSIVFLSVIELHYFFVNKTSFYGRFCNFLNIILQLGGFCNYPFIFILLFDLLPLYIFISAVVMDVLVYKSISLTFYAMPLLLISFFAKLSLLMALSFVQYNLENIKKNLLFTNVSQFVEQEKLFSSNSYLNRKLLAILSTQNLVFLQVTKSENSSMDLNVVKIYYIYTLFLTFEEKLLKLQNIFNTYNKVGSMIKDSIFIILILFLLSTHISYILN